METKKILLRPTEAAQLLGISRSTLYRWMNMDGFPVLKIGGCTRILADALKDWAARQQEGGRV